MSTRLRRPHQTIQPYQFGHPEQKTTNLWLKNLPQLIETNNVYRYMMEVLDVNERERVHHMNQGGENGLSRSEARSLTFAGIAAAKAQQYSQFIINERM